MLALVASLASASRSRRYPSGLPAVAQHLVVCPCSSNHCRDLRSRCSAGTRGLEASADEGRELERELAAATNQWTLSILGRDYYRADKSAAGSPSSNATAT